MNSKSNQSFFENSRLLTVQELSLSLNAKESHIRQLVFRREIPFLKVGRLVRFDRATIETWLASKGDRSHVS